MAKSGRERSKAYRERKRGPVVPDSPIDSPIEWASLARELERQSDQIERLMVLVEKLVEAVTKRDVTTVTNVTDRDVTERDEALSGASRRVEGVGGGLSLGSRSLLQDFGGLTQEIQDCNGARASANVHANERDDRDVTERDEKRDGRDARDATTGKITLGGRGEGGEQSQPQAQEVEAVAEAQTGARPILRSEPTPPSGPRLTDELSFAHGRSARDRFGPPRHDEKTTAEVARQLRELEQVEDRWRREGKNGGPP